MKTIPFGSGRDAVEFAKLDWPSLHIARMPNLRLIPSPPIDPSSTISRGYSFERNCVLRRWESETLK